MRPNLPESDPVPVIDDCQKTSLTLAAGRETKRFAYDRVFAPDASQVDVYEHLSRCVPACIQGYNVSVMAYGQSGSGKSYTMGTVPDVADNSAAGIVPRAARHLFTLLSDQPTPTRSHSILSRLRPPKATVRQTTAPNGSPPNWTITVTYVEIYNEQLRDLLRPQRVASQTSASAGGATAPTPPKEPLAIREDAKGGIYVQNLHEVVVDSPTKLFHALQRGSAARQTGATNVNAHSSRSHAVFTINLTQRRTNPETGVLTTLCSKLNFVDLAGSERIKHTQAIDGRVREGISINAGLTSLGKVISQLSLGGSGHVSYRDSKLTRLLQDSLGGRAITYLVACITNDQVYAGEALNTLTYALRARAIQAAPEVQATHRFHTGGKSRDELAHIITELQQELVQWKTAYSALPSSPSLSQTPAQTGTSAPATPTMPSTPTLCSSVVTSSPSPGNPDPFWASQLQKERFEKSDEMHRAVEKVLSEHQDTIDALRNQIQQLKSDLEFKDALVEELSQRLAFASAPPSATSRLDDFDMTPRALEFPKDDALHREILSAADSDASSVFDSSLTQASSPPSRPISNVSVSTGINSPADPLTMSTPRSTNRTRGGSSASSGSATSDNSTQTDGSLDSATPSSPADSPKVMHKRDQAVEWKRELDRLRADRRTQQTQTQHYLSQWKTARSENQRLAGRNALLLQKLRDLGVEEDEICDETPPADPASPTDNRQQTSLILQRRHIAASAGKRSVSLPLTLGVATSPPRPDELRVRFARPRDRNPLMNLDE